MTHSTALKNTALSSGIKAAFDSTGVIKIYSGSAPGANAAATGVLLATLTMAATAFGAPSGGVLTAAAIASDTNAAATGTAAYFRMCKAADAQGATGTSDPRIEGTVGTSGTDIVLNNVSITAGGTVSLTAFTITWPA